MSLLCRIYVVGIVQLLQILETSSVLVSRMKLIPSNTAKITDRLLYAIRKQINRNIGGNKMSKKWCFLNYKIFSQKGPLKL